MWLAYIRDGLSDRQIKLSECRYSMVVTARSWTKAGGGMRRSSRSHEQKQPGRKHRDRARDAAVVGREVPN